MTQPKFDPNSMLDIDENAELKELPEQLRMHVEEHCDYVEIKLLPRDTLWLADVIDFAINHPDFCSATGLGTKH